MSYFIFLIKLESLSFEISNINLIFLAGLVSSQEHDLNPSSTTNFGFFPLLHDALILATNQLSGSIPSELGLLTNVVVIDMCKYGRRVDLCWEEYGWNPSSTYNFVFFPLLHHALILARNQLSGAVPSELFAFPNLLLGIFVRKWIW